MSIIRELVERLVYWRQRTGRAEPPDGDRDATSAFLENEENVLRVLEGNGGWT